MAPDLDAKTKRMRKSWHELVKMAQDRNLWRTVVDGLYPRRGERQKLVSKYSWKVKRPI